MADHLRLLKSPLVGDSKESHSESSSVEQRSHGQVQDLGYRDGPDHDCPEFQKHNEATNSEVFFDLFFAANLSVFADQHDITDMAALSGYIAYFCVLWLTWALIGLYDVRFVTDSIFERIARGAHLGIMTGLAVVAPNFDPTAQVGSTFRVMSVVLLVSRIVLACQYGSIIWHVRNYKNTKLPLGLMVGINLVAAIIYLGLVWGFQDYNTYVYVAWYVVAIVEIIITVGLSLRWKVLSFKGTHLINRMAMLTFIMLGEGIIVVCLSVGRIVKNPDAWTSATIGNVLAGIANIYVIYMIYFDFMRHTHLSSYRQLGWSLLHFPFHLAVNLFVQGSSQFVIWWKIIETMFKVQDRFTDALAAANDPNFDTPNPSFWYGDTLNTTAYDIYALYPPQWRNVWDDTDEAVANIEAIPNEWWSDDSIPLQEDPVYWDLVGNTSLLYTTLENSLFNSFKINGFENIVSKDNTLEGAAFENAVNSSNWGKFYLVFTFAYVCAGLSLILMNILLIFSRTKRWTPWNYTRVAINFLVGIAFCLVALIQLNDDQAAQFQGTPWVLPTILLVFFAILVLNHLPHPPPIFFKRKDGPAEEQRHEQQNRNKDNGRASSWDVVGHLGYRSRKLHEKVEPGVRTTQTEGYEIARPQNGEHAV